jgi:hypothetical protein
MNGNNFLLDTNAVLYLLNGDETLADFLFEKQLYISIITEIELLSYKKITAKEQKQIQGFINELEILNINQAIKNTTIITKHNSKLKLPDAIIAATSIVYQIPLLSADRQFKTLDNLDLIFYES